MRSLQLHRYRWHSNSSHYNHYFFSTSDATTSSSTTRNRVPKALYRQLLCWCRRNEGVPFNPLPPLTLAPPQVNPVALGRLKEMRSFLDRNSDDLEDDNHVVKFGQCNHPAHYALYKGDIVVKDNLITFPEIRGANELRSVIRSVYWLNNEHTIANIANAEKGNDDDSGVDVNDSSCADNDDAQKGQISLAFEAIKSCNELSSNELDSRIKKRESSIEVRNRKEDEPLFHVGQVIQHKKAKWRGVIVGWAIEEAKTTGNRLTSLTTKQYEISEADSESTTNKDEATPQATVKYTILVDMNDSSLLHLSKSISLESQQDLIPVDQPNLRRIQNHLIHQYFSNFDPNEGGHFSPNKVLNYVYPLDRFSNVGIEGIEKNVDPSSQNNAAAEVSLSPELQEACEAITNGVQDIGHRLLPPVLDLNKQQLSDDNKGVSLASTLLSSLQSMSEENERGISSASSPLDLAISSVKKLNQFYAKLIALQWSHSVHKKNENNIDFKLGQTVKHKLFNFKGVVVAWDPKPHMDVSQWDGLQGVENPNEKPFYHIRPDINDCIREFGGPRSWRYVCQDNLEPYDLKHGRIELEMELDEDEWGWDKENGWFAPSEEIRFMHAEDVGENEEAIKETIQRLKEIISDCFLSAQGRGSITGLYSLDDLFYLLNSVGKLEDATAVQDMIKEVFKEFPDSSLRKQLDAGISELIEGKTKQALETFTDIVATEPAYGEAWNKKATVHYMLGERQSAIDASNKALEADPRNFQALAGIGLVEMDAMNDKEAITAFQQCLALNPWSMVSARLSICMSRRDRSSSTSGNVDE